MHRKLRLIILASITMVSFQNCSPAFYERRLGSDSSAFGAGACSANLKDVFSKTYHPFLQHAACVSCHVPGGGGSGEFADSNLDNAYSAFMTKGYVKVTQIAESTTHHFDASAASINTSEINSFSAQWSQGYTDYLSCLTSGSQNGADTSLATIQKAATTLVPATVPTTTAPYVTISWSLDTDAMAPNLGRFQATASLDIRPYYLSGVIQGLEFRNPIVKLNTGSTASYLVTGLHVSIDGTVATALTAFNAVSGVVNSATTGTNLAPGSTVFLPYTNVSNGMKFSLQFNSFMDGTGTGSTGGAGGTGTTVLPTITYTLLKGTQGSMYAVFSNNCISCHGATNPAAGFDLTTYASASATGKPALIVQRMTSATNPMPPSGMLTTVITGTTATPIDVVKKWVTDGILQ